MFSVAWSTSHPMFLTLIFLQVLQGALPLVPAILSKSIIDLLVSSTHTEPMLVFVKSFVPILILQILFSLLNQSISPISFYIISNFNRKLNLATQVQIYAKITKINKLSSFEDPTFHDNLRLATQNAYAGPAQLITIFASIVRNISTICSFATAIVLLSPILGTIIFVSGFIPLFTQSTLTRRKFMLQNRISPKEREALYISQMFSQPLHLKEIFTLELGHYFIDRFILLTKEVQDLQRSYQLHETKRQIVTGIVPNLAIGGIFALVIINVLRDNITIGDFSFYLSSFSNVQNGLLMLVTSFLNLHESILFFSHYKNFMSLPETPSSNSLIKVSALTEGIELRNISFRYSERDPWILHNINLFIPRGKCIALIGLNGTGKTTLVKLLTRLYDPTEGCILWDGIDIRNLNIEDFHRKISAVFQDFVKYDFTARDNIGLGDITKLHEIDNIQNAAVEADIHEKIEKFPEGYDTILSRILGPSEKGTNLSGGEWQKIAIARVLMKDADFYIFDEPTSALDPNSEQKITSAITSAIRGRTALLITHRLNVTHLADVVAVLNEGQIIEYGSHEELMTLSGTYAHLYDLISQDT